jgi:hypothetical protein
MTFFGVPNKISLPLTLAHSLSLSLSLRELSAVLARQDVRMIVRAQSPPATQQQETRAIVPSPSTISAPLWSAANMMPARECAGEVPRRMQGHGQIPPTLAHTPQPHRLEVLKGRDEDSVVFGSALQSQQLNIGLPVDMGPKVGGEEGVNSPSSAPTGPAAERTVMNK